MEEVLHKKDILKHEQIAASSISYVSDWLTAVLQQLQSNSMSAIYSHKLSSVNLDKNLGWRCHADEKQHNYTFI